MSHYEVVGEDVSLVVLGNFTPTIFQPEWFIRHEIGAESEFSGRDLEVRVIHKDLIQFSNSWLVFEVVPERFSIRTNQVSRIESLRDLAVSIFNLLPETPVKSFGVNLNTTVNCDNDENWHRAGDVIAPKEIWRKAIPEAGEAPGDVGTNSVEIQVARWDERSGMCRIHASPSSFPPDPALDIRVNDHIDYEKEKGRVNKEISEYLIEYWDESLSKSRGLTTSLLNVLEEKVDE